ncbi:MAG: anthranilate synthase component I [Bacillota bacterium]
MIKTEKFLNLSENYNLIPVYDEIIADTETPVSLYKQLSDFNDYSFLLESASSDNKLNKGRYSFIGIKPEKVIKYNNQKIIIQNNNGKNTDIIKDKKINEFLDTYIKKFNVYEIEDLPPFSGGLVGYFSYEMIDEWEDIYHNRKDKALSQSNIPDTVLVIAKLVIAYDHLNNTLKIIDNIYLKEELSQKEKINLYNKSKKRIKKIITKIRNKPVMDKNKINKNILTGDLKSNTEKEEFKNMVSEAKKHIKEGDAFQIVLSQKFSVKTSISPFQVYRALRVSNPSPYMFYLNFPDIKLMGSSPEVLVKVNDNKVITRPLAGTRKRGKNRKEDLDLKNELLNDEKEKAEHIMLVDLGRNDLGRVCKTGSIEVTELLGIEYFTRVMHLVSQVEGEIKDNLSILDVLSSVFPAGTVSGAPKIRAMEIIDKLEKEPRGVYAGAVGYLDFRGNLDTCITIRTFSMKDGVLSAQIGAGMVADSIPEKEYKETLNKAKALFDALKITREEEPYGLSN